MTLALGTLGYPAFAADDFLMEIDDVLVIERERVAVTGEIDAGRIHIGSVVCLERQGGASRSVSIGGIEQRAKLLVIAKEGDAVGLLLDDMTKDDVAAGDTLKAC